jgi:hypothetical protein
MESGTENDINSCQSIPPLGCRCEYFYRGGQVSHYNVINNTNHLPINRVRDQEVTWYITSSYYFTMMQ